MIIDSSTKLCELKIKISFKLLIPDTTNRNGSKFISGSFYYHIKLIITFIFFFFRHFLHFAEMFNSSIY